MLIIGPCALAACDRSEPLATTDEGRLDVFIETLGDDLQHRTLIGYGGRKFEIVFEPNAAHTEPDGPDRWIVSIPHWQKQQDASMKYTLSVGIHHTAEGWELADATLLYHGTRDENGYQAEPGYKPIGVLKDTKGNVYAGPLRRSFEDAFD